MKTKVTQYMSHLTNVVSVLEIVMRASYPNSRGWIFWEGPIEFSSVGMEYPPKCRLHAEYLGYHEVDPRNVGTNGPAKLCLLFVSGL